MIGRRMAPWRKGLQWLVSLMILATPFIRIGGESLLRMDAPSRTLLFFGAAIRIEEFYLVLIAVLLVVFGFLFVTMVSGRVWCGWFCPQTTLTDLADFVDARLEAAGGAMTAGAAKQVFYLFLSLLVAANLVWYFIPPAEFFTRLLAGRLGMPAGVGLAATSLLVYLDLVLVRRRFCSAVCPYGRIQLLAMDRNTLTLGFDPRLAAACSNCGACRRACPVGIDIKAGLQIECINCGRCVDACRDIMAKLGREGLIGYSFGSRAEGGGRPLNTTSLLLAGIVVALSMVLAVAVAGRQEATLKVQAASGGMVRRLPGGGVANSYTAFVANRSARPATYELAVSMQPGMKLELLGPVKEIPVAPNANRRVDFFAAVTPAPGGPLRVELRLVRDGRAVAVLPVTLHVQ